MSEVAQTEWPNGWSERVPSPAAYCALRKICALGPRSEAAAAIALQNHLYAQFLYKDSALIAMGRIVGDGGTFAHIVDVAVHPEHRGGLGTEIMARLNTWCDANLPVTAYVGLISHPKATALYERAGFYREIGMGRVIS